MCLSGARGKSYFSISSRTAFDGGSNLSALVTQKTACRRESIALRGGRCDSPVIVTRIPISCHKLKGGLSLKVSEKGGVSLYGMGRFPVTLYKEQWLRILASAAEIEAFIRENDSKLKAKE